MRATKIKQFSKPLAFYKAIQPPSASRKIRQIGGIRYIPFDYLISQPHLNSKQGMLSPDDKFLDFGSSYITSYLFVYK